MTAPTLLFSICSCHANLERRVAVRETWASLLPQAVALTFFVGEGAESEESEMVQLAVADDYKQVAEKMQAFCRHALANFDFDYLFKCDDDTYVHASRLLALAREGREFVGSHDLAHLGYAQGGAGYLLSRRAVERVAAAPPPYRPSEDIWVSLVVQQAGIPFHSTSRLQMSHYDLPRPSNDLITAHWCSPQLLRLIHEGFMNPGATDVSHFFLAQHPEWWGTVKLLQNGVFLGRTGDPSGTWELSGDRSTLVLDWYCWPKDTLHREATGYRNDLLRLDFVGVNGQPTGGAKRSRQRFGKLAENPS